MHRLIKFIWPTRATASMISLLILSFRSHQVELSIFALVGQTITSLCLSFWPSFHPSSPVLLLPPISPVCNRQHSAVQKLASNGFLDELVSSLIHTTGIGGKGAKSKKKRDQSAFVLL